jgi:hypothetical protein
MYMRMRVRCVCVGGAYCWHTRREKKSLYCEHTCIFPAFAHMKMRGSMEEGKKTKETFRDFYGTMRYDYYCYRHDLAVLATSGPLFTSFWVRCPGIHSCDRAQPVRTGGVPRCIAAAHSAVPSMLRTYKPVQKREREKKRNTLQVHESLLSGPCSQACIIAPPARPISTCGDDVCVKGGVCPSSCALTAHHLWW